MFLFTAGGGGQIHGRPN